MQSAFLATLLELGLMTEPRAIPEAWVPKLFRAFGGSHARSRESESVFLSVRGEIGLRIHIFSDGTAIPRHPRGLRQL